MAFFLDVYLKKKKSHRSGKHLIRCVRSVHTNLWSYWMLSHLHHPTSCQLPNHCSPGCHLSVGQVSGLPQASQLRLTLPFLAAEIQAKKQGKKKTLGIQCTDCAMFYLKFFLNELPPQFLNIKISLPLQHCIRSGKILMFIGQKIILSDITDTSLAVYEITFLKKQNKTFFLCILSWK